jgi:hypothetical protein
MTATEPGHDASRTDGTEFPNGHETMRERKDSGLDASGEHIENFRPMSVIVIGAGFSGIYCGVRIPERLRNVKLTIYEKNAGVGGTWYENRYPGCACDIPCKYSPVKVTMQTAKHNKSTFLPVHICTKSKLEQLLCASQRDSRVPPGSGGSILCLSIHQVLT